MNNCKGKEFECPLATMIENLPNNRPLYKDSGLWQIRSDDMEEVLYQQEVSEDFVDFIDRQRLGNGGGAGTRTGAVGHAHHRAGGRATAGLWQ